MKSQSVYREYIQGGGVACYLRDDISFKILENPQISHKNETEFLIVELKAANNELLLFATVYRRPKGNVLNVFFATIQKYIYCYKHIFIAGDLNSDLLNDCYYSLHLRKLIYENSLYNIPFGATHHKDYSDTWLDVILTNSPNEVLSFEKSASPYINGHDFLIVDYRLKVVIPKQGEIMSRDFTNFKPALFSQLLFDEINQKLSVEIDDVNVALNVLQTTAIKLLDKFAPFKTRKLKNNCAPWFTKELKLKCKARDKLYKQAKRKRDPILLVDYKKLRRDIKYEMKKTRDDYCMRRLSNTQDKAKFWAFLSKMGLVKQRAKSPLSFFSADELIEFYATVANAHPPCSLEKLEVICNSPCEQPIPEFSFKLVDRTLVHQTILSCFPKSKGRSCDGLSICYFMNVLPMFSSLLTDIFNLSITTSAYPSLWKKSIIIPLCKVPKPSSPSDTRPIYNIPHFAKVFDKIITAQIKDHLDKNELIDQYQSGFRSNFSTQSALLKIVEDVRKGIDKGLVTVLVLFDFRKAFDTINHEKLMTKLKELNFTASSIKWIHSYLSGRSQAVLNRDGATSKFLHSTSGVPQGSTPGPIIFLIYINSILSALSHCKDSCMLFADDLQFYFHCKRVDLPLAIRKINEDISSLVVVSKDLGLSLNEKKILAMILGSDQNLRLIDKTLLPPILVNSTVIPFAKTVKNLGVMLSDDLSWNAHVRMICSRVHGILYSLRLRGQFLSSHVKKQLVTALILPHFDYCSVVLLNCSQYLDIKLTRLLNTAIRFIFYLRKDTALKPFYKRLNWLKPATRRNYFLGILVYNVLQIRKPLYLHNLLPIVSQNVRRGMRINANKIVNFDYPKVTTCTYQDGFAISAMNFWDNLDIQIKLQQSIETFKVRLYNFLFQFDLDKIN